MNAEVAIIKSSDGIENALDASINLLGGLNKYISSGENILLKPNLVAPRKSVTGATTSLEIISHLAKKIRLLSAKPILYEFPGMEYNLEEIDRVLSLKKFCKENQILFYAKPDRNINIRIRGGRVLKNINIPEIALNSKIINIPKFKTHVITGVTFGMKNLMGILDNNERRKMHALGIDQSIVDLNMALNPALTIVDGLTAMQGDGAVYGDPVSLNLIICGTNTLAIDNICCQIASIDIKKIRHIDLANRQLQRPEIKIIGEKIDKNIFKFIQPQKGIIYQLFYRLMYLIDYPFRQIFNQNFNRFLYKTGRWGTRPALLGKKCDSCGDCLKVCPYPESIDLKNKKINPVTCIRCLSCYDACKKNAISVRGYSRPAQKPN